MIETFTVEGFKSIEKAELPLGNVNVFIGANGAGKSNLLEAVGVLAAAAYGRVDSESITRRGCRSGTLFLPQFASSKGLITELRGASSAGKYSVRLVNPANSKSWEYQSESWTGSGGAILDRTTPDGHRGDPQIGRAALRLSEMAPENPAALFLKALAEFAIYTPDALVLRGWVKDPQDRDPVGLSGGSLPAAMSQLRDEVEKFSIWQKEAKEAIGWLEVVLSLSGKSVEKMPKDQVPLQFVDRFFSVDEEGMYVLGPDDVNEGALYFLFIAVLCLHPDSPSIFAIDNADHGLNPLLARRLMSTICKWILPPASERQILMTTHNPLALDGLPLQDDRVRLFTVDRDNLGRTQVQRFVITDKHRDLAAKGWTLSRMWVNKLIGGVPDV